MSIPFTPNNYLEQFPANKRSTVANNFYAAVRALGSHASPSQVLEAVKVQLWEKQAAPWRRNEKGDELNSILDDLGFRPGEAYEMAEYVIWRESLPVAEREKVKAELAAPHIQEHMAGQLPTDKQIKFLKSLGYKGEVRNKAHASELIEQCLKQKAI